MKSSGHGQFPERGDEIIIDDEQGLKRFFDELETGSAPQNWTPSGRNDSMSRSTRTARLRDHRGIWKHIALIKRVPQAQQS